ncbi:hypothetical protein ACFQ4C_11175 [Larkinella insperata]|uniref:Lipoprotein n=1 Tax=Larkinella insperata TaxID=332158 RepID=A0ABW3QA31_9BACT|nr:hypothetical protein [Larkinella insperata]
MKKVLLALVTLFAVVSCKDKEEIKPENLGTYLIYTSLNGAKFDQVEVKLNGKTVGVLTKSYAEASSPACETETSASILRISQPAGSYSLDAIATMKGKAVTKWSDSIRIEAGYCSKTRLTSKL